ncbi:pentatricopeptide repeat-containing protein At1g15510, chloroplastic-like [Aristolochia californica]|uniref:pentatricopeptide repeat-containing protein At1g15510, chloroplastic-like n=1 Tax=Aristolochia californica TaxID=171875 RepID=UPI0035D5CD89
MNLQNIGPCIHLCSKTKAFRQGICLHAVVIKLGFQSDIIVSNHVLNMYAKCNDISSAHHVFDEMLEKNIVSWSAMISGYDQANRPSMALYLFSQLQLQPNEFIYASVINSCTSLSAFLQGKQVHARSMKSGYVSISFVSNSLIGMYMNGGLCEDALSIFKSILVPNSVSYNSIIAGFAENMQFDRGLELFKLMNKNGFLPDRFTFAGVFGICTGMENLHGGVQLHCEAIKLGLHASPFVGNVILTMYSKCSSLDEAAKVFESIEGKDVISWNTFITSCTQFGEHFKALKVFVEMQKGSYGLEHDDFTLTSALAACASLASIHYGRQIHGHLIRTRVDLDAGVSNALVNMYAKCGLIKLAESVFDNMSHHNVVSWNTLIFGFGNHGDGRRSVELFEKMKVTGITPDSVTFVGLLIACNHAGLMEEGQAYFDSMEPQYGITPKVEHICCIIDLLGRAGRLEEAEGYLNAFPHGDDLVILGSLLSACLLHGSVNVGQRVGQRILELEPGSSSPYVLLSNLYASDGKWEDVAEARRMLKGSPVKKVAGHSLIEVGGNVEKFTVGDFTHPRSLEIEEVLRNLSWAARKLPLINSSDKEKRSGALPCRSWMLSAWVLLAYVREV